MTAAPEIPAEVLERQRDASDPVLSAWVSANAGSGKTYVLAQRVIRLLLGGTPPSKDPLPHLHQGGRRQHGDQRVRQAGGVDCARRPRAR